MRVGYLAMGFACISYLALGSAPTQVSAQLFSGSAFQQPAVRPQPAPSPAQPVPTAMPPQVPASAVMPPPANGYSQAQPEREGRIVRGSQWIGLNIRGSDNLQLGIVKDFVVDCQGECPTIYFAVEPDASLQLGQEYVIMPYGAMQYRDGSRGGGNYFALGMNRIQLRNAPHVAVNTWSAFNDRQVLGNAHQFYQRTERTAARPIEGGTAKQNEQGTRPETAARPDTIKQGNSSAQPEIAPRLGAAAQPEAAPLPQSAARPNAAVRPKSGERPATGAPPESKVKEPVEPAAPHR